MWVCGCACVAASLTPHRSPLGPRPLARHGTASAALAAARPDRGAARPPLRLPAPAALARLAAGQSDSTQPPGARAAATADTRTHRARAARRELLLCPRVYGLTQQHLRLAAAVRAAAGLLCAHAGRVQDCYTNCNNPTRAGVAARPDTAAACLYVCSVWALCVVRVLCACVCCIVCVVCVLCGRVLCFVDFVFVCWIVCVVCIVWACCILCVCVCVCWVP